MRGGTACLMVSIVLLASSGGMAADPGAKPAVPALEQLQADFPAVRVYQEGARISRLYGTPFAYGATPEEAVDQFRVNHADVFGVAPDELVLRSTLRGGADTQPVMYDPETGRYKFTLVRYAQYKAGIPVFQSELGVLVRNAADFPVVLAASSLKDLGDFVPAGHAVVFDPATQAMTGMTRFTEATTVVWAGVNDEVVEPVLAVTFIGENDRTDAGYEKWRFVCDAATGAILYQEAVIHFTDVTGSVQGMATEGAKTAECNPESLFTYPWAKVGIQGGTTVYADGNGDFTIPNAGTTAVTVQSYVDGLYFTVDNRAGAEETLSQSVTPPGPADFVHNQPNSDELVRAQVNAYVSANGVRDWVLDQNPSFPGISTETLSPIVVNRTDLYCPGNAWSDPTDGSINFCSSGGGYPNTAWQSVVNHEYGHHVIDQTSSGQGQYGEGMADCHSMLPVDDPVLGYGFYGDCDTGLRNADNTYQYPCTGEIHDCGQLLSGCIWSTRNELILTEPSDYLVILSSLTVNSIMLHTGDLIAPQITIDFLTLDDDDGNLDNGTPHYDEITTGFGAHNMWAGPPPENDDCGGAAVACPGSYSGTTSGMTVDGSASCGSSNSTPDVWYKYKPQNNGTLHLETCDSGYDTVLSVHTGCPGTSGNQVACNDDTGWFGACSWLPTSQSALDVSVTAGNIYYIRVSGSDGATGNYVLDVSGPACAPIETCDDGILNQGEERIDCGGPCPPCACLSDAACSDGAYCTGTETCDAYGNCQSGSPPCGVGAWCYEDGDACVTYGNGDFEPNGRVDLADF
ncbi:MAG: hypothetical protein V2A79_12810, partial [Planctomycetota bacterium]